MTPRAGLSDTTLRNFHCDAELIDQAAQALHAHVEASFIKFGFRLQWKELSDETQEDYRDQVRVVLPILQNALNSKGTRNG